jgi:uncharacterized protein (DUF983 family)
MNGFPYRAPPPMEADPYAMAWADLRRRRTRAWVAILAWLPVGGVVGALAEMALRPLLPVERIRGLLIGPPLLAIFAWFQIHRALFRCPKCGNKFHSTFLCGNPWTRRCLNCGIQMGTPKAQDDEAEHARQEADAARLKAQPPRPPPRRPHLE